MSDLIRTGYTGPTQDGVGGMTAKRPKPWSSIWGLRRGPGRSWIPHFDDGDPTLYGARLAGCSHPCRRMHPTRALGEGPLCCRTEETSASNKETRGSSSAATPTCGSEPWQWQARWASITSPGLKQSLFTEAAVLGLVAMRLGSSTMGYETLKIR